MYSTVEEIRLMLKEEVLESFLSNDFYEITDPAEKERITVSVVKDAISDADAEINGYLGKRYPLPLSFVPKAIKKYSKDIAIYNLASRSGMKSDEREHNYYIRYKNAMRYLEMLAKGTVDLDMGDVPQEESPLSRPSDFRMQSSPKIFGRENMKGY